MSFATDANDLPEHRLLNVTRVVSATALRDAQIDLDREIRQRTEREFILHAWDLGFLLTEAPKLTKRYLQWHHQGFYPIEVPHGHEFDEVEYTYVAWGRRVRDV